MPLTVAQLVARLTADTSGFYRSMAIANASMIRTGGIITRVAAGAGLAVTGIGLLSLRAAGNFQQSMNILQAVSGATAQQMSALDKEAIALGADMKLPNVSAKDAADAMSELAKGGLSVNQILGATRGTLQLGIAANMGFADSATIIARALSAFSLSGKQATTVADLFTATANKSTADMTDVALGFQMASAQFAGTGHTIDELTTSLGLMANAGVVGSDAGTSLKTMINRLTAPTAKAKTLMDDLGISVYDASGNMRSMPELIGQLNKGMRGMSQEQRNAALYTIFGSDAIRAARIQMKAGVKGWNEFHDSITKGGEAQAFAEARTKGFNGALQALGSAAETLAIQLGTYLLPVAEKLVRALANFIASINAAKVAAFFAAIAHGIGAVITLVNELPILKALLVGLITTLLVYKTVMMTASAAMRIASAAMFLLDAAVAANPFVLLAAAIVGLAVALIYAYKHSETFRNIVNGVFSWLKNAVMTVVDFVRQHWMLLLGIFLGPFPFIVANIVKHWTQIKNFTMSIFNSILGFFRKWWPLIVVVMTLGMAIVYGQIVKHWRAVWNFTKMIWGHIKSVISSVVNAIVSTVKTVLSPIIGIVSRIFSTARDKAVNPIHSLISKISSILTNILSVVTGFIADFASAGFDLGKAIVTGLLAGLWNLASSLAGKLKDGLNWALDQAKGAIGAGSPSKVFRDEVGLSISQGIVEGIVKGAKAIPRSLSLSLNAAVEGMGQGPMSPPASIQALSSGVAGQGSVVNNYYSFHGAILDGDKLLKEIKRAQERHGRVNGGRDPLGVYA